MPDRSATQTLEALELASRFFFRAMTDCLARNAALAEASATQFRALAILSVLGDRAPSRLAEDLGIGRPAATRLANRLVRAGLASRVPDPGDRRRVILRATRDGRALVSAVRRCRRHRLERVLASLDPGARRSLGRALPALIAAFEATGPLPAPGAAGTVRRPALSRARAGRATRGAPRRSAGRG